MKYQFIAEFYQDIHSEKPVYKTHLWGVEDAEYFIKEHGFTEVAEIIMTGKQAMQEGCRLRLPS